MRKIRPTGWQVNLNIIFQALYLPSLSYASCWFLFFEVRPKMTFLGRGLHLRITLAVVETGPDQPQGAAQRRGWPDAGRIPRVSEPKISTGDFVSNPGFVKKRRTTLTQTCPGQPADLRLAHWPKCLPACEFGVSRPFWVPTIMAISTLKVFHGDPQIDLHHKGM